MSCCRGAVCGRQEHRKACIIPHPFAERPKSRSEDVKIYTHAGLFDINMAVTGYPYRILRGGLAEVDASAWNRLSEGAYPFLRHEFLLAMETRGCLGEHVGWFPMPLVIEDSKGQVLAALPLYLKNNSFGEFVFDWSWAEAYERAGLSYYPKLVAASPFTPATGPRLLIHPEFRTPEMARLLVNSAIEAASDIGVSSLHWLFANDVGLAESPHLSRRVGCQFHWTNNGYGSFEEFLSALSAKRRKEILRERRQVREAGVELIALSGDEVPSHEWQIFHNLYCDTFDRHGNFPAMTQAFFTTVAAQMGEQVRLVLARRHGKVVAAAYFLVGQDCLYGRYWGTREEIPGLHFEACYYQGIEYCISRGLRRFEPGAQGEHKISRGFLPTQTCSYHWMAHSSFRSPIQRFVEREALMNEAYMTRLMARSPYKVADAADS